MSLGISFIILGIIILMSAKKIADTLFKLPGPQAQAASLFRVFGTFAILGGFLYITLAS